MLSPRLGRVCFPMTGRAFGARIPDAYRYEVDVAAEAPPGRRPSDRQLGGGTGVDGRFETDVSVDLAGLDVVEMLHIDLVRLHMLSSRTHRRTGSDQAMGTVLKGMRLGKVEAGVTTRRRVATVAGTEQQLARFSPAAGAGTVEVRRTTTSVPSSSRSS